MLKIQFISGISAQPMEVLVSSEGVFQDDADPNTLVGFYYLDANSEWVITPLHVMEAIAILGEDPMENYEAYLAIEDHEDDSDEPIMGSKVLSIEYVEEESI